MPVTVKTFETSEEAAAALSSERDVRYLGGGTLVMRALNEGDVSISTIVRAKDRALAHLDVAGSLQLPRPVALRARMPRPSTRPWRVVPAPACRR